MVTIRAAGPEDAGTLLGFITLLADFAGARSAVEVDAATLRAQLSNPQPPFEAVLAEKEGKAVGFAVFDPTYSTWQGRQGMWLEDLFVLPEARGQGIGARLLAHLAAIANGRGYGRLHWFALESNKRGLAFYEGLGAKPMNGWNACRLDGPALSALAKRAQ